MSVITCQRADLAWALRACLPHVLRERDFLPSLEGVRLEADPDAKTLYCVATDRFTIGCARVDAVISEPAQTLLSRADVGEMLRRLKGDGECELAIWDDGDVALDWRARWQGYDFTGYDFADWREMLGRALRYPAAVPGPGYGWDAEFMARFRPAMRDGVPLVFMPVHRVPSDYGAAVPVTVVLGEQFAGAAMSVTLPGLLDAPAALRRWRELLPKEAQLCT